MWRRPSGRSSVNLPGVLGGTVRVVVAGEHEHRTLQAPKLRRMRHRRQRQVVGAQRHAEQREGGDPAVVQRLAQGDARAERPATGHRRQAGGLLADPRDGRSCVADLVTATAVRAAGAHHAAEVEQQDGEAADPGEFVAQGPHDRVVLAATVLGMGVAQDGGAPGVVVGAAELALDPQAVVGRERHGLHGLRRWQPWRRRDNQLCPAPRSPCGTRGRGRPSPGSPPSATNSGTGRSSCPRSPGATRSLHSRVSRTRPLASCSAPASCR